MPDKKELLLICASDPSTGALNVSADESTFDVEFSEPLSLPGEPTIKLLSAQVYFNFPNIITGVNDTLTYFWRTSGIVTSGTSTITFAQGLYSLAELDAEISRQVTNDTSNILLGEQISLVANNSTGKAVNVLRLESSSTYDLIRVNWSTSSIASILGFTTDTTINRGTTDLRVSVEAANQATLNAVNAVRVHCTAANGSLVNGSSSDTLCEIPIDVNPGEQINYTPRISPRVPAPALSSNLNRMTVRLTDEKNQPINLNGEIFTVTLLVEY